MHVGITFNLVSCCTRALQAFGAEKNGVCFILGLTVTLALQQHL